MHVQRTRETQTAQQGRGIKAFVAQLLPWYAASARDLPWRRTRDPYGIWVSEIMLQQTQVKTVIPYYERWMRALPSLEALAACRTARLLKLWEGLGYYHRARNLRKAARFLVRERGGRFPSQFNDLLQLPGIGPYTAGAISSIAFNQPAPILDGNAMRVLTRFFGVEGDPRSGPVNRQLWALAEALVASAARFPGNPRARHCAAFNQALMELGATICTVGAARCSNCPVAGGCFARQNHCVQRLPALAARRKAVRRRVLAFVAIRQGRILVRQRPQGVVNAGLWEFPNVESSPRDIPGRKNMQHLCTVRHCITRYRFTLEAFLCQDPPGLAGGGKWLSLKKAVQLAFASAHRKVLAQALSGVNHSIPGDAPARAVPGGNSRGGPPSRSCAARR